MLERIYLDHSATTPASAGSVAAMLPFLTEKFGNASSIHSFGQEAKAAVDKARHQIAGLINSRPNEVIFTSGGTEANNLAIRGLALANRKYGSHIIISDIEHPSVKNVCEDLEKQGFSVTRLPVYDNGIIRLEDLENVVTDETFLISIMFVNNEIGTIQPVDEIGKFVRKLRESGKKIWFHTDAVQAAGKVKIDVEESGCDLLTISAHKIYAPKGSGALYVRRGTRLQQQNIGGRQERGVRGGTESVALLVAFGAACEAASEHLDAESARLRSIRDRFEQRVLEDIPDSSINGDISRRVSNISNISFENVEGEALLINLDMKGIAASTGSACSSGSIEPSPVILALGRKDGSARGAIRFSFGASNDAEHLDRIIPALESSITDLRRISVRK